MESAGYCRMSQADDLDEAEGDWLRRQKQDIIETSQKNNDLIDKWYVDEDKSAYRIKQVVRDDWIKLLAGIRERKLNRVYIYHLDRLLRHPKELEQLIDLVEQTDCKVYSAFGDIDLKTPEGQFMARINVNVAHKSSADTARRVKRAKQHAALNGDPPKSCKRPYGYAHAYASIIESEAAIFREIVRRFLAGESVFSIKEDLNKRGITTQFGYKWRSRGITRILARSEYCGIRSYGGEEVAKGTWPTIINEPTYRRIQKRLSELTTYNETTARKHLLSGILVCQCGTKMQANHTRYWCSKSANGCGRVSINRAKTDAFVLELTTTALNSLVAAKPVSIGQDEALERELAKQEAKLTELQKAYLDDVITLVEWTRFKAATERKLATLRKQAAAQQAPLALDTARAFVDGTVDQQRATIKRLYGVIGVIPAAHKGQKFVPERLQFN